MQNDTVFMDNVDNKAFGMDGDDKFAVDIGNIGGGAPAGFFIDGGHSSFNAAQDLQGLGFGYQHAPDNGGFGDTLFIQGTGGSLDFASSIGQNQIRGIERLDVKTSGVSALVTMTYQDIIDMTDFRDTLIIRADGNDQLNFTGTEFSNFTQVGDDVAIADDYDGGGAATGGTFDVLTDGNVTLLIESGATYGSGGANDLITVV